jgi:hypothetical protein
MEEGENSLVLLFSGYQFGGAWRLIARKFIFPVF